MAEKRGSLSINSENIFPIIKKWLYSDHDIFYRELISNACDAITKLKKLDMMGEYTLPDDFEPKVQVLLNPEEKTIKFIDNGLGMTADEVEEYINQIAFSGATDFIEKYKDKSNDDQIIGHFGLGFYSAFMVADEVTIDTFSQKYLDTIIEANMSASMAAGELVINRIVREKDNIRRRPDFSSIWMPEYDIYTISSALENNASITVGLSFEQLQRQLLNANLDERTGTSYMDVFFQETLSTKEFKKYAKDVDNDDNLKGSSFYLNKH